jgi:hypothetical protein
MHEKSPSAVLIVTEILRLSAEAHLQFAAEVHKRIKLDVIQGRKT